MKSQIEKFVNKLGEKGTLLGLLAANIIIIVFAITFHNSELLPLANMLDFVVLFMLTLMFALYRPGWAFLLLVGMLPLENINLMPESIGFSIRPYQLITTALVISLVIRKTSKRLNLKLFKLVPIDYAVLALPIGGFISGLFSYNFISSFKITVVSFSYVLLYFLFRLYISNKNDLMRVAPFFLSSALSVTLYGIWQNFRFVGAGNSFQIMPGRPNATFTEPDWFGMFLVFVMAFLLVAIVVFIRQRFKSLFEWSISSWSLGYMLFFLMTITWIGLVLTVARSAWVGAIFIVGTAMFFLIILSVRKIDKIAKRLTLFSAVTGSSLLFAIIFIMTFGLSNFEFLNRLQSTSSGLQEITISCKSANVEVPKKIQSAEALSEYDCKHINLEEIESEVASGNFITTTFRPDPNVSIRKNIYAQSLQLIKSNPLFGVGWGNIGERLGTDERGTSLNSSNIFLESWLGGGFLGFLALISIFILFFQKARCLYKSGEKEMAAFLTVALLAIIVPNLFNAGLFLGFLWGFLSLGALKCDKKKK